MDKTGKDKPGQNLSSQTMQNLSILDHTNLFENKEVNLTPNTSLKTNTNDDEAFADFLTKFHNVATELTGRRMTKTERANLSKLADLLILELKIAARRTGSISSVPAFLTEVLRRKLLSVESAKPSKTKIDTVGKGESESYEIKALDQKGREAALNQLLEFAGDLMLEDFKKWYTTEDWEWLTEQLKGK